MSRILISSRVAISCVPRASGDEPRLENINRRETLCSPRERG